MTYSFQLYNSDYRVYTQLQWLPPPSTEYNMLIYKRLPISRELSEGPPFLLKDTEFKIRWNLVAICAGAGGGSHRDWVRANIAEVDRLLEHAG